MRFSILHISDLHRDPNDEVSNEWLLQSLANDFDQFEEQDPTILRPSICIVSGDLVHGSRLNGPDADRELKRQYDQAVEFLEGLADRFFEGNRERIIILPGNHDVSHADVMDSVNKIDIPAEQEKKDLLVKELFKPNSKLRWSWRELCFFKINNDDKYRERFRHFAAAYEQFYQGKRHYSLEPSQQFDVFDFPDFGFCLVSLNSCFNNDPLRRIGSFHPQTLTEACGILRDNTRIGWLTAAAWHHNLVGGPAQDDYLDASFLQLLIDAGASLGFHGHQHLPECFDERYRLGSNTRKITIVSASTLCAEPTHLRPGIPRSYNIVELDTDSWTGLVHQRQMVNQQMTLPVWGPGHFINTNSSFLKFELCKPKGSRPRNLDLQLILEKAEKLIGEKKWQEALDLVESVPEAPLARPLMVKALEEIDDNRLTITKLWPPNNNMEGILLGSALLDSGSRQECEDFMNLEFILNCEDASIRDICSRISQRRLK
jgi:hypothetical protein